MEDIWSVLEIEPTQDIAAIRQAYAQKTRICHPEEDPEGFLRLRKAYQAALDYAEGKAPETQEPPMEGEESEDEGWTLSGKPKREEGPNPYEDSEATRQFLELYASKQRKDSKRWLDYFTSSAFLDAAWNWRFTALLLEHVTRLEGEYPVNREFLNWLCVAYRFTVNKAVYLDPDGSERTEFSFQIHDGAQFEGQEYVFEIATKGPAPKRFKGNELAVFYSFTEYHSLLRMAEVGVWSEKEVGEFSQIIGRYAAGYITDKCQQRRDMDYERHPASLRLMAHFFRRDGLPEELYRIVWQKLDLKTAIMGRAKIFYGPLRERVLELLPELAGEEREDFSRLRTDFRDYSVSIYKKNGENAQATEEDIRRTDAFFARADFQKALLNRRFVEEDMLHTSVAKTQCDYYLKKVIQFYTEHETAPCAQEVIDRAKEMLRLQKLAGRLLQDREAKVPEGALTLRSGPFFRHWINTGFYQARDPESGRWLRDWLYKELPYLPEWSAEFLEATEERILPKVLTFRLGGDTVEVRFHLRYMEFLLNQSPVYRPCLEWENVVREPDLDAFFFFLPITVTTMDRYGEVKTEILRRLGNTAAPEDGRDFIAACLAERVCSLPLPGEAGLAWSEEEGEAGVWDMPQESVLPFELFSENLYHLYGCEWNQRGRVLILFEQFPTGRQWLKDGLRDEVADEEAAVSLARQMLEETLTPPQIPVDQLANLPDAVYARPDFNVMCQIKDAPPLWSSPVELLGEAVTTGALEELLSRLIDGQIDRLELSWNITPPVGEELDYEARRSLVILKGGGGYACLYFDDFRAESYALLEKPELYGKLPIEFASFRQGKLFNKVIHRSISSIRRRLDVIFRQVSWPNNVKFMAGGIWDYAVNVAYGRSKYNLDKQLLGDFPMERAHSRPDAPLYFSGYPNKAACVDSQGNVEALEIGQLEHGRLQDMITRFLQGGFPKLRMTWGKKEGKRRHIVLLQDGGRFLMAWILEEKRTVEYHVADVWTYMDVEGKKYPKDTFQGRVTPAYLIHDGVTPLRNALELLLANIDTPSVVTGKFAEYAYEKPWKPRTYEAIWVELSADMPE